MTTAVRHPRVAAMGSGRSRPPTATASKSLILVAVGRETDHSERGNTSDGHVRQRYLAQIAHQNRERQHDDGEHERGGEGDLPVGREDVGHEQTDADSEERPEHDVVGLRSSWLSLRADAAAHREFVAAEEQHER